LAYDRDGRRSRRPDIGLPGLSGYEIARALRADARTRRATLVALTCDGFRPILRRERAFCRLAGRWHEGAEVAHPVLGLTV